MRGCVCISLIRTEVAARGNLARPTNKQVSQRKVVEYAARQFTSYVITRLHPIVGESTEKLLLWMWESYHHSVQYHLMKWKSWKEWSTKASDASKRSSLVLSNPRCLISQIAVTFEGDRAGVRGEAVPGGTFFFFFFFHFCLLRSFLPSLFLMVRTALIQLCPPSSEQILF